jgi:hypothetical protein
LILADAGLASQPNADFSKENLCDECFPTPNADLIRAVAIVLAIVAYPQMP